MSEKLIVRLKSPQGKPIPWEVVYTVDQRNFPFWSERRSAGPGEWAIAAPKTQPFGVCILWEVPDFGKVIVTADNEGKGYRLGEHTVVDFRIEAAKTKVKQVRDRLEDLVASGYAFERPLLDKVKRAEHALQSALAQGGEAQAASVEADEALSAAFWAGEEIELAKARADIAAMGEERRRSLRFGAPHFQPNASDHFNYRFAQVFNFATVPFYRASVEPVEGVLHWEQRDRILDWLESKGITPKGHPLFWVHEAGMPNWMRKLNYATLKEVVYRQVYETVSRYKDRIKIWDVINEAHDTSQILNLIYSREQQVELTALVCRATRDADPDATRIVNCNRPWGYYRDQYESRDPMHAIEYLELLEQRGVEYEVLGLQLYHGGMKHWVRDMAAQSALLDQYIALGKPIHITEFQTPSSMERERDSYVGVRGGDVASCGWWHRPWDLETQADWVEQFYTIAVSKPQIGAVTWWSFSDRGTFWPHGGFLDKEDLPKPSFYRLKALIESIKSEN
jgi:GH35 family endo-1,4-beta-xylanase